MIAAYAIGAEAAYVYIRGEYWNARSVDDDIDVDEDIEIVGIEGLTLTVKREVN